jgi:hypothetical protein
MANLFMAVCVNKEIQLFELTSLVYVCVDAIINCHFKHDLISSKYIFV